MNCRTALPLSAPARRRRRPLSFPSIESAALFFAPLLPASFFPPFFPSVVLEETILVLIFPSAHFIAAAALFHSAFLAKSQQPRMSTHCEGCFWLCRASRARHPSPPMGGGGGGGEMETKQRWQSELSL